MVWRWWWGWVIDNVDGNDLFSGETGSWYSQFCLISTRSIKQGSHSNAQYAILWNMDTFFSSIRAVYELRSFLENVPSLNSSLSYKNKIVKKHVLFYFTQKLLLVNYLYFSDQLLCRRHWLASREPFSIQFDISRLPSPSLPNSITLEHGENLFF